MLVPLITSKSTVIVKQRNDIKAPQPFEVCEIWEKVMYEKVAIGIKLKNNTNG